MDTQEPIEHLAYQLYELATMRRDMWKRAGFDQAHVPLLNLVRVHGPVRVSAVAEEMHVDVSVASRQLAALEERGLVERTTDPDDGRSRLLAITPAGEEKLSEAHRRMVGVLETTVEDWSDAQVGALTDGMTRLRTAYSEAVSAGRIDGRTATAVAGGAR